MFTKKLTKKKLSFFLIVLVVFVFSFPAFAAIDYPNFASYLPPEEYPYFIEFEYWEGTTISDNRFKAYRYVVFFEDVEGLVFPLRELTMLSSYGGGVTYALPISDHYSYLSDRNYRCYYTNSWNWNRKVYDPYKLVYDSKTNPHTGSAWNIIPSDILRCNFDIVMEDGNVIPGEHPMDYYVVDDVGYLSSEQKYQLLEWERKWEQNVRSQFFVYFPDPSLFDDYDNPEEVFLNFAKTRSPSGRGTVTLMFYEHNGKWDGYIGFSGRFAMQLPDMKHESILSHVNDSLYASNSLMDFILQYVRRQYESIIYDDAETEKVHFIEGLFNRTIWTKKFKNLSGLGVFPYIDRYAGAHLLYNSPLPRDEILFMESEYYYDSYALSCGLERHDNHIWRISTWFTDVPSHENVTPSPLPEPTPYLPSPSDVPFPLPTEPYDDTDWRVPDIDVPNFMDLIYRKLPIKTFDNTWSALNRDYSQDPPSFKLNLRTLAESAGASGNELNFFPSEDIELADFTLMNVPFLEVTVLDFLRLLLSAIMIWKTFCFVYTELTDNTF